MLGSLPAFWPWAVLGAGLVLGGVAAVRAVSRRRSAVAPPQDAPLPYRALFDASPVAQLLVDARDGSIAAANAAAIALCASPARPLAGTPLSDVLVVPSSAAESARLLRADGTTHELEVHWCPCDVGGVVFDHLVLVDVGDRHALARQRESHQRLEAIGALAGGIAHDFNNLLTSILGFSDLARRSVPPDAPLHADLSEIHRAAERGARLVRRLLAFGRRQTLRPRLVDFDAVVAEIHATVHHLFDARTEVHLELGCDGRQVLVDPSQLEDVVISLCLNARDAMPDGGMLVVSTAVEGDEVQLRVADDGVGMDAEMRARIFEPFFTTKGPGVGTGLGLSSALGIVEQSGGRIQVESVPGMGSTFVVCLPAAPARDRAARPAERAARRAVVLVVDEDSECRRSIADHLRARAHTVLAATDPEEALRIHADYGGPIDVLVADLTMSPEHGPALLARFRERQGAVRVVWLSRFGHADGERVEGYPVLGKPFTVAGLLRAVEQDAANA